MQVGGVAEGRTLESRLPVYIYFFLFFLFFFFKKNHIRKGSWSIIQLGNLAQFFAKEQEIHQFHHC